MHHPMTKPSGSIDLDGVTAVFLPTFLQTANTRYCLCLKEEDVVAYDFQELGLRKDQIYSVLEQMVETHAYENLPVVAGASHAISRLGETYDIMSVTSRIPSAQEQTMRWATALFPGVFSRIVFNGHDPKRVVLQKHSCAFHIDDCPDEIKELENTDVLPILFTRQYNLEYKTGLVYHEGIHEVLSSYKNGSPSVRVFSWEECVSLVMGIHPK